MCWQQKSNVASAASAHFSAQAYLHLHGACALESRGSSRGKGYSNAHFVPQAYAAPSLKSLCLLMQGDSSKRYKLNLLGGSGNGAAQTSSAAGPTVRAARDCDAE